MSGYFFWWSFCWPFKMVQSTSICISCGTTWTCFSSVASRASLSKASLHHPSTHAGLKASGHTNHHDFRIYQIKPFVLGNGSLDLHKTWHKSKSIQVPLIVCKSCIWNFLYLKQLSWGKDTVKTISPWTKASALTFLPLSIPCWRLLWSTPTPTKLWTHRYFTLGWDLHGPFLSRPWLWKTSTTRSIGIWVKVVLFQGLDPTKLRSTLQALSRTWAKSTKSKKYGFQATGKHVMSCAHQFPSFGACVRVHT